jgi:TIR domain
MPVRIFISYRHGDEPGFAHALYARLEQAFAAEHLFMDVEGGIRAGDDFVQVLDTKVAQCDVLLVLIGSSWLTATDTSGARRLENQDDFVRVEIESALRADKRVIPVLINTTEMPRATDLPPSLQPLVRRSAVRLTHERFRTDAQGLIKELEGSPNEVKTVHGPLAERHGREAAAVQQSEPRRVWRLPALWIGGVLVACIVGVWLVLMIRAPVPPDALTISGPDDTTFRGPQGGPFSPPRFSLRLKATGPSFRWSMADAIPDWLSVTPNHGELERIPVRFEHSLHGERSFCILVG